MTYVTFTYFYIVLFYYEYCHYDHCELLLCDKLCVIFHVATIFTSILFAIILLLHIASYVLIECVATLCAGHPRTGLDVAVRFASAKQVGARAVG